VSIEWRYIEQHPGLCAVDAFELEACFCAKLCVLESMSRKSKGRSTREMVWESIWRKQRTNNLLFHDYYSWNENVIPRSFEILTKEFIDFLAMVEYSSKRSSDPRTYDENIENFESIIGAIRFYLGNPPIFKTANHFEVFIYNIIVEMEKTLTEDRFAEKLYGAWIYSFAKYNTKKSYLAWIGLLDDELPQAQPYADAEAWKSETAIVIKAMNSARSELMEYLK